MRLEFCKWRSNSVSERGRVRWLSGEDANPVLRAGQEAGRLLLGSRFAPRSQAGLRSDTPRPRRQTGISPSGFKAAALCTLLEIGAGAFWALPQATAPARHFQLQALSPQFWNLVARQAKLRRLASGFGFAEGPVWDPKGFLYVSDEVQNRIYRVEPDGRYETVAALGDPDGNTYDLDLRLIDCASVLRALIRVSPSGEYTTLVDRYQGERFNSPNDVVVGPDQALYFTDPTLDLPPGQKQEIPFQGVYRLDARGNVRLETKDLTQPNGLGFSPDGRRLYVDDSAQRNIRVYTFSAADGSLSEGRVLGDEKGGPSEGVPDGMRLDLEGDLFVVGPKGIWVWDSQGHHLGTIVMPEQPANLAWGDKDWAALYITATTSVYYLRTRVRGFVPYLAYAHRQPRGSADSRKGSR
jgi:gluconolactonase